MAHSICKIEGCTNYVVQGGLCHRHGAKRPKCSTEGCTNNVVQGGLCHRHGAKRPKCRTEGCTNQVQKGGVCIRHGGKRPKCSTEGCTNAVRQGGLCHRHGGKRPKCSTEGCTNAVKQGGLCFRHGAKVKLCSHEGCYNTVLQGGLCKRHGAKRPKCRTEGCFNNVVQGGLCLRHGAKRPKCRTEGCTNTVQKGGLCKRHGATTKRYTCSHEGCNNRVVKGGVCIKHGAKQTRKRKFPADSTEPETTMRMGAVRMNQFRGGAGNNDTTPKVSDSNDVSPGHSSPRRSTRRSKISGQVSNQQQNSTKHSNQDSTQHPNDSSLQMPSMDSPAPRHVPRRNKNRSVDTNSGAEWLSRTQAEDDIGEVDRFSFSCGGTVTANGSGVHWLKDEDDEGNPLDYAIVGSITNGSYADRQTDLQVGDVLVPLSSNHTAAASVVYFKHVVNSDSSRPVYIWRRTFMKPGGSITEKSAYYTSIMSYLKRNSDLFSSTDLGTYQGRILPDETNNNADNSNTCGPICVLISKRHAIDDNGRRRISNDEIKEIIDRDAPTYATLIRAEYGMEPSSNMTSSDVYSYLIRQRVMHQQHNPEEVAGNILKDLGKLETILGMDGPGNIAMSIYFKEHFIVVLRTFNEDDSQFAYDFIEPLATSGNACRETFYKMSCLMTRLREYLYHKFCNDSRYSNVDELANARWHEDMLTYSNTNGGDEGVDQRIFMATVFMQSDIHCHRRMYHSFHHCNIHRRRRRRRRRHDNSNNRQQQQQHPPPPPPQLTLTMKEIISTVDPVFYSDGVDRDSLNDFVDAVKAKYNMTELTTTVRELIKKRLSILSGQPSEQKLKLLVDESFAEADNINEETAAIIAVVRSKWLSLGQTEPNTHTATLTDRTIKAIKKRLCDWRIGKGNGVRRLKKTDDGDGLRADKLFANLTECVNDVNDLVHQQSHQPMDEETNHGDAFTYGEIRRRLNGNGTRIGGFAIGECYYELLSKSNELSTRQKLARINETEGMIQKLVINEAGVINISSYRDMDECIRNEFPNMNANDLRKELKKGVYKHPSELNIYFRFRYRIDRARTFTDSHILALHQGEEKFVEVRRLPDLQVKSIMSVEVFHNENGFNNCQDNKELRNGGFIYDDKSEGTSTSYYANYRFPFSSNIRVPSQNEIYKRYLAQELKGDNKKLYQHIEDDCRETRRLYKDSTAPFADVINETEAYWHASIIKLEDMDRTEDDKKEGIIRVQPANDLEDETREAINPIRRRHNADTYTTRRALHSLRLVMKRLGHQPWAEISLFELNVEEDDARFIIPVGLCRQGRFRTNGQDGMYKIALSLKIKRSIRIKLGTMGNLSDPDSSIVLERDGGKMDVSRSVNMKRGVQKDNTELYNDGLFNLNNDVNDNDDESIGQEKTVFGGEVKPLAPVFNQTVRNAQENIKSKTVVMDSQLDLVFENLSGRIQGVGKSTLKKAFNECENEWKGEYELIKVWCDRHSNHFTKLSELLGALGYVEDEGAVALSIEFENKICYKKGLELENEVQPMPELPNN